MNLGDLESKEVTLDFCDVCGEFHNLSVLTICVLQRAKADLFNDTTTVPRQAQPRSVPLEDSKQTSPQHLPKLLPPTTQR